MVARGPGAVGCAHCRQLGAEVTCAACKHLVCPACAADWTTCDQPCSRTFQLGRGERLLDVDPSGRLGLVSGEAGKPRYVELKTPRRVEADVHGLMPAPEPRLTQCIDDEHDLIVSASRGEIIVRGMVGLEPVCDLETTGTVTWVAIAFPYLAALVRGGAEDGLLLWKLGTMPAEPSMLLHLAERVRVAALSRDGRYLAAAFEDHRLFVRDIEGGGVTWFHEHTAAITLLRFVGADHELVTADDKGRVVLRTHAASGYLRDLVTVPVRGS